MPARPNATMGLTVTLWQLPCGIFISDPSTHLLQMCGPTFLPSLRTFTNTHYPERGRRGSQPGKPALLVWRGKERLTHLRALPGCWSLGSSAGVAHGSVVPLVWAALALLALSDTFSLPWLGVCVPCQPQQLPLSGWLGGGPRWGWWGEAKVRV